MDIGFWTRQCFVAVEDVDSCNKFMWACSKNQIKLLFMVYEITDFEI